MRYGLLRAMGSGFRSPRFQSYAAKRKPFVLNQIVPNSFNIRNSIQHSTFGCDIRKCDIRAGLVFHSVSPIPYEPWKWSYTAYGLSHTAYGIRLAAYGIRHTAYRMCTASHTAYGIRHTAHTAYGIWLTAHMAYGIWRIWH